MATIEIKHLIFGFDIQEKLLFDDINVNISSQWKLALIGRNGRGKTTLLNLLAEKYRYKGDINTSLKFNYFPQKISNKQQLTYTILQNLLENRTWIKASQYSWWNTLDSLFWTFWGRTNKNFISPSICGRTIFPPNWRTHKPPR